MKTLLTYLFFSFLVTLGCEAKAQDNCGYEVRYLGDQMAFYQGDSALTDFVFTEVAFFNEGYVWVNKGELYAYLDSDLNEITPYIYTDVSEFENGLAIVSIDSSQSYQLIDTKGHVLAAGYQRIKQCSAGYTTVLLNEKWGLLDPNGNAFIQPMYEHPLQLLEHQLLRACLKNKWGIIDLYGNVVVDFTYDLITPSLVGYPSGKKLVLPK
ncbi:MAG: hypothetical protein ACI8ZN_001086 [Bacteroidia bacterium]